VVEKGSPGYQARVIEGKVSLRSVWQADITLDNVRVPAENRLPGARSFKDTSRVLATTRSTCAWAALGHATSAWQCELHVVAVLAYRRARLSSAVRIRYWTVFAARSAPNGPAGITLGQNVHDISIAVAGVLRPGGR